MQSILAAYDRSRKEEAQGGQDQVETTAVDVPLEREPEVVELVARLRELGGELLVGIRGREMGISYSEPLSEVNGLSRRRVGELVYSGAVVPYLLCLLPRGAWNAEKLAWFAGMGVPAARAQKGKGRK